MQKNTTNKLIAVTIGDIKGVGIEILIKEWKNKRIKDFILITNYTLFKKYISSKKSSFTLISHKNI